MKILFSILTLVLFSSFKFGEPVATLNCKSVSGRTFFKAEIPSGSYLDNAEFIVDNAKLDFSMQDNNAIIFDPDNKVLTVYLESKDSKKFLRFWAIPSSFKKVSSEKGPGTEFHDVYEFHAKIEASDPRNGKQPNTPRIELVCTLDYEL